MIVDLVMMWQVVHITHQHNNTIKATNKRATGQQAWGTGQAFVTHFIFRSRVEDTLLEPQIRAPASVYLPRPGAAFRMCTRMVPSIHPTSCVKPPQAEDEMQVIFECDTYNIIRRCSKSAAPFSGVAVNE